MDTHMFSLVKKHDDFLIINKFAGVSFHKQEKQQGLPEIVRSVLGIKELFTVHRLDTMTSGLLLFARNRGAAKKFSYLFRKSMIEKYYLAISDRRPKKKQGLVTGDMVKARRGGWKLTRTAQNPAITQFISYPLGDGLRLFVLKPRTGKTHQIRVALKSIGAPVLGDPLYYGKSSRSSDIDRGYLHSYGMRFTHRGETHQVILKPDTGKLFTDRAVAALLNRSENPWELNWPVIKNTKLHI